MQYRYALIVLAAALIGGCARVSSLSEVHPDGSWHRKLTLAMTEMNMTGGAEGGPKIEDTFQLPSGEGWKIEKSKKDGEDQVIAQKDVMLGAAPLKDLIVLANKKPQVTNTVTVKQLEPGKFEYREVLHWSGDKPEDMMKGFNTLNLSMKKYIPDGVADDAMNKTIATDLVSETWKIMFGPGDPLFSLFLMHKDLAERRLKTRVGHAIEDILGHRLGEKLDADKRHEIALKMINSDDFNSSNVVKTPSQEDQANQKKDDSSIVSMLFSVKLPGKVVSTNGEVDYATGEIYWALYGQAAALGDVTMVAVCEVK